MPQPIEPTISNPTNLPVRLPGISAHAGLLAYLIFGAAVLSPLLWAAVPPLVDYPNHLARMWILVQHAAIPELARNYVVSWRILPDLAMDLVVPALARFLGVVEAGRVFIGLTMLGLIAGTATLHRVLHGRFALWPVCCGLFVYNAVLFWGFLSCLFAIALYLFAFSGWIASRDWRPAPRLLLFSAIAAALFLLHAFAFGLYGLSVASYEIGRRLEGRRLPLRALGSYTLMCVHFIPGLALWYLSLDNVRSAHTAYGSPASKLYALLAPVTFGMQPVALDLVAWVAVALTIIFLVARGALKLAPEMRLPLAAMAAVAILMPNVANGSWLADIRLPVVLPFVVIAGTRLELSQRRLRQALATAALILFGLRIGAVSQSWRDYDRWFGEFRSASSAIAPGARLLIVETPTGDTPMPLPGVSPLLATVQPPLFWHMGALAVIDRAAFFPYLFTEASPIDVTPANKDIAQSSSVPITPKELAQSADPAIAKSFYREPDIYGQLPHWRDWPRRFDYVLWIDLGQGSRPDLPLLRLLKSGAVFELYRIVEGEPAAKHAGNGR